MKVITGNLSKSESQCNTSLNAAVSRCGAVSPSVNLDAGGPPLSGYPRLFVPNIYDYSTYSIWRIYAPQITCINLRMYHAAVKNTKKKRQCQELVGVVDWKY
jgi:hypothetical protein